MTDPFWAGFVVGATLGVFVALVSVALALIWVWEGCPKDKH
jgi:hypothetical protein